MCRNSIPRCPTPWGTHTVGVSVGPERGPVKGGGRCWRQTTLAPALVPWDPSVLFTVSWGRVARLGKLACEGIMELLCSTPKTGLPPFTP